MRTYQLGGGVFAIALADSKWLLGVGNVQAPNPALILTTDQLNELRNALDVEDEYNDDFGK